MAYLAEEPSAAEVETLLGEGSAMTTSVNLAEAVDVICGVHGAEEEAVLNAIDLFLATELLAVTAPDAAAGLRAAQLRTAHYRRRERPLSLADCFLLAAGENGHSIATADPCVAEVARLEEIELIALPDSSGRRP